MVYKTAIWLTIADVDYWFLFTSRPSRYARDPPAVESPGWGLHATAGRSQEFAPPGGVSPARSGTGDASATAPGV